MIEVDLIVGNKAGKDLFPKRGRFKIFWAQRELQTTFVRDFRASKNSFLAYYHSDRANSQYVQFLGKVMINSKSLVRRVN